MELKIEVIDKNSENVAASLRTLLADEHVLSTRTREAYVKVNGSNFSELRMLFEHQCESLDAIVADISKRVLAIGQIAPTKFWDSLAITRLNTHNERFTSRTTLLILWQGS
jgi:starvation-inducible DNA-binding protein